MNTVLVWVFFKKNLCTATEDMIVLFQTDSRQSMHLIYIPEGIICCSGRAICTSLVFIALIHGDYIDPCRMDFQHPSITVLELSRISPTSLLSCLIPRCQVYFILIAENFGANSSMASFTLRLCNFKNRLFAQGHQTNRERHTHNRISKSPWNTSCTAGSYYGYSQPKREIPCCFS